MSHGDYRDDYLARLQAADAILGLEHSTHPNYRYTRVIPERRPVWSTYIDNKGGRKMRSHRRKSSRKMRQHRRKSLRTRRGRSH